MFIRHGHAHTNLDPALQSTGLCLGMTERGLKEVTHAAHSIADAGVRPAYILYSPAVRAHQTALAIARVLELDDDCLKQADELREREYGDWGGQNPDDLKEELIAGHVPEGSETQEALFARLDVLLDTLSDLSADGPVLAASHGGIWQGLHDMFGATDIPWIDTGDIFALRINRVARTITSNCLFSQAGGTQATG